MLNLVKMEDMEESHILTVLGFVLQSMPLLFIVEKMTFSAYQIRRHALFTDQMTVN